jgi:hypothetical protein
VSGGACGREAQSAAALIIKLLDADEDRPVRAARVTVRDDDERAAGPRWPTAGAIVIR